MKEAWVGDGRFARADTRRGSAPSRKSMESATKITLLRDEYLLLQNFYENFDTRIVTIKGWSATVGMAAIGAGFYQTHYLWLFGAAASLVFWLIESLWKSFQYMYSPRIERLERAFASDDFTDIAPFQVYTSWFETLQKDGFGVFGNFRLGIVAFPHAITFVAGIILFALHAMHWITLPVAAH
jgi:hypothetical protein